MREQNNQTYEGIDIIRDFVNTRIELEHIYELATPAEVYTWFHSRHLLQDNTTVTRDDWQQILALREALRNLLLANNGFALSQEHLTTLNQLATRNPLSVRFPDTERVILKSDDLGVAGLIAYLLGIVYTAIINETWYRLKACRNTQCQRAFYDLSKNQTRAWCTMLGCGNRMKARRYRVRHNVVPPDELKD